MADDLQQCACGCGGEIVPLAGRGRPRKYLEACRPSVAAKTPTRAWTWRGLVRGHSTDPRERPRPATPRESKTTSVLIRAWRRFTAWTTYAVCSPDLVPARDPNITGDWIVYLLVDPRNNGRRYIGQSTRGLVRPREHRSESRHNEDNRYLKNWVSQLRRCGFTFEIVVLEFVPDGDLDALNAAEMKWIARGRAEGWRLTNLTEGGGGHLGLKKTPEQVEAMRAVAIAAARRRREVEWAKRPAEPTGTPLWRQGRDRTESISARMTRWWADPKNRASRSGDNNPMRKPTTKKVTGAAHHMKRPETKQRHKEAMERVGRETDL